MAIDQQGNGENHKPIAFISHHSSQEKTARHLKTILERNGVQGWMAPDDIEPGRPFDEAIVAEVAHCDLIVLLFCSQSDQSRHVKRELMMAENQNKLVYPVRLEDIDAKGLAYWLNDYQWIDWIDRRDATIERLIDTVKRQVAAKAPPPPIATMTDDPETADSDAAGNDGPAPPPAKDANTTEPKAETEPAPPARPKPEPKSAPAPKPKADAESPIPEPPSDRTPAGLTGSLPSARQGGAGSGDGKKSAGITSGTWIFIGVVGFILLMAIVLAIGSSADDDGFVASSDPDLPPLRPGNWEITTAFTDVDLPGSAPAVVANVRRDFEPTNEVINRCITGQEADDPTIGMFVQHLNRDCTLRQSRFGNGDVSARADCSLANIEGPVELIINGSFDRTAMNSDVRMNMNSVAGRMALTGTMSARRTGPCN